jgi:type I restriction enzyme S subunit
MKLSNVITLESGFAFKSVYFNDHSGTRLIRIRDVNKGFSKTFYAGEFDNRYLVNNGDFLITMDGEFNISEWNGGVGLLNQRVGRINVINSELIEKRYLLYLLPNILKKIESKTSFVTVKHLPLKEFINYEIYLPNIQTQKKIVRILNKAQGIIDKRKAQIEALDQLVKSVFLEMFGEPKNNPYGWNFKTIKDLTEYTQYGTSKKASETIGNFPMLRMNNITYGGSINYNDLKYIDLDEKEKDKYLVTKGDLLFNRTNSKELVGKTAVYKKEEPMAFAGYLIKLVPNSLANSDFISGYLNSKYGKSLLLAMAKTIVGMANINATELKSIKIYTPPIELQNKFANIVQKIETQKALLQQSLTELENNFQSLMQRAFRGELFSEDEPSHESPPTDNHDSTQGTLSFI